MAVKTAAGLNIHPSKQCTNRKEKQKAVATLKPIFDAAIRDKLVSAIKELSQRGFAVGMKEVDNTLRQLLNC